MKLSVYLEDLDCGIGYNMNFFTMFLNNEWHKVVPEIRVRPQQFLLMLSLNYTDFFNSLPLEMLCQDQTQMSLFVKIYILS